MTLSRLPNQNGVKGVRLLSCWVHPKGFFEQFPLFSCEHSLAIAVQEQAVAEHLVQTGCSASVLLGPQVKWTCSKDENVLAERGSTSHELIRGFLNPFN